MGNAIRAEPRSDAALQGPELAIVIPTFKERLNIEELSRRLCRCLGDVRFEVIFVDDDSPDGTAEAVWELSRRDARFRCIQRIGRRGLASACVEGMLGSGAPYVAVMDADLQHDEAILLSMLQALRDGGTDIVVGSRYTQGGSVGDWDSRRSAISRLATRMSRLVTAVEVTDPMSGFFMMRREVVHASVRHLSAVGFKILLDILASHEAPLVVKEIPYRFRNRVAGESKLDSQVAWEYAVLLVDKLFGRFVPARFILFAAVGAVGVLVHLGALLLMHKVAALSFVASQAGATLVAMTSNFALNNELTYRDKRLRGRRWLLGWVSFVLACSLGAAANVGVADYMFGQESGWLLSALAGILVGTVWNFTISSFYVWKNR